VASVNPTDSRLWSPATCIIVATGFSRWIRLAFEGEPSSHPVSADSKHIMTIEAWRSRGSTKLQDNFPLSCYTEPASVFREGASNMSPTRRQTDSPHPVSPNASAHFAAPIAGQKPCFGRCGKSFRSIGKLGQAQLGQNWYYVAVADGHFRSGDQMKPPAGHATVGFQGIGPEAIQAVWPPKTPGTTCRKKRTTTRV
jgi:hypothetical protein